MKARIFIGLIMMVCFVPTLLAQNTMKPAPEGSIVKGRLVGNVGNQYTEVITAGYVFALSATEKKVLGYTTPARGTLTTGGGEWEISGLPLNGKVLFVGYASNVHRMCWMQEVVLDGRKYYHLGDNVAYMVAPSSDPAEAGKGVLQALFLVGWFAEKIEQGKYYEKVDKITAELDKYLTEQSQGATAKNEKPLGKFKMIETYGNGIWHKSEVEIYWIFKSNEVVMKSEYNENKIPNNGFYQLYSVDFITPNIMVIAMAGMNMYKLEYVSE